MRIATLYGGDYVSTWKTLCGFVADGRLRSAGVSNFQPEHLDRLVAETGIVPAVNQFEIHPYFTTRHRARRARGTGSPWRLTARSVTTVRRSRSLLPSTRGTDELGASRTSRSCWRCWLAA
jgi:hypothetical protein